MIQQALDVCFGTLMGFEIQNVPLLKAVYSNIDFDKLNMTLDSHDTDLNGLRSYSLC